MSDTVEHSLPIGTTVHERYRVEHIVGRGGLGTVYAVRDVLYGRNNVYALKELADQSRAARRQFENEAQWLQALDHNHIPKVREYFEWHNRLYLVMDFVDGENLEQFLARNHGKPLSEQRAVQWILPICDALQYLHSRVPPILHRDVKPANIIVTPAGHPVLVDLGIAKEHLPGANQTATFVRKAGTEGYSPPEQYTTAGKTGPWSDVYAVGATLYHLLTGRVPPSAVERAALGTPLPRVRELNPQVSPWVDATIWRALALRPAERFQSVADFARALTTQIAPSPSPEPPAQPSIPPYSAVYTTPVRSVPPPPRPSSRPSSRPYPGASRPSLPVGAPSIPPPRVSTPGVPTGAQMSPGTGPLQREQLERVLAATVEPERPSETQEERGGNRGIIVLGVVLVCALALAAVAAVVVLPRITPPDRSSPQATINGYFGALHQADYANAWLFVSASRNDVNAQSSMTAAWRTDDARYGMVNTWTIASSQADAAGRVNAVVNVERGPEKAAITYVLTLTQYDGSTWLIESITAQ